MVRPDGSGTLNKQCSAQYGSGTLDTLRTQAPSLCLAKQARAYIGPVCVCACVCVCVRVCEYMSVNVCLNVCMCAVMLCSP